MEVLSMLFNWIVVRRELDYFVASMRKNFVRTIFLPLVLLLTYLGLPVLPWLFSASGSSLTPLVAVLTSWVLLTGGSVASILIVRSFAYLCWSRGRLPRVLASSQSSCAFPFGTQLVLPLSLAWFFDSYFLVASAATLTVFLEDYGDYLVSSPGFSVYGVGIFLCSVCIVLFYSYASLSFLDPQSAHDTASSNLENNASHGEESNGSILQYSLRLLVVDLTVVLFVCVYVLPLFLEIFYDVLPPFFEELGILPLGPLVVIFAIWFLIQRNLTKIIANEPLQ
jgi:hypothetical protein